MIGAYVMAAQVIHTDDTPIAVLAPGNGKTRTGRIWTYLVDERPWQGNRAPAAYYRFTLSSFCDPICPMKLHRRLAIANFFDSFGGVYGWNDRGILDRSLGPIPSPTPSPSYAIVERPYFSKSRLSASLTSSY
jgi:hypothetical protein